METTPFRTTEPGERCGAAVTTPSIDHRFTPIDEAVGVSSDDFRSLMSGFPTGVAVLTTVDAGGVPRGMTCSSVCSVTLQPPTLLVCVRSASATLEAMTERGAFAINLLHEHARTTAELFASGAPDRFDRVGWQVEPVFAGPHLVDDAHAVADCRITRSEAIGDHVVVFGEVFRVGQHGPQPSRPLLYGMRRYLTTTN
jgi:flavin reductase (DIM6/NTAB) family NADH-FMN oxidoreductase RutF